MSGKSKSQVVLRCLLLFSVGSPGSAWAATLKSETVEAWHSYVAAAKSRIQSAAGWRHHDSFADKDEMVNLVEPVVNPVARTPTAVPGGLIHDWMGKMLIPDTTISAVVLMMRDYRHYHDYFRPGVITASLIDSSEFQDHFTATLAGKSLGVDSALEGEYTSTYVRVDDTHWYSVSESTHMREIEHYRAADQYALPGGEGRGFIWKLFTITTFEQREGGVAIEVEAIALSRDIPSSLRWIAMPIVKRVSRASLVATLKQTSEAVRSRDTNLTVAGGERRAQTMDRRPKNSARSYR